MTTRAVERRIVTVLFADLVGFTSLSEPSMPKTSRRGRTPHGWQPRSVSA